ncbi:hypothetical protein HZC31_07355 [Candidatus Woesearchaeota archaeon]|nr:hypothetical protein [Candidatus Woesearchaeota archaeon]
MSILMKITIKSRQEVLNEFAETYEKLRKGENVKKREELSFNSIETLRSFLTEKRMELLKIIKHKNPNSIYELAQLAKRDLKSVNTDVKVLSNLGLLFLEEINEGRKKMKPIVEFDTLNVEIVV